MFTDKMVLDGKSSIRLDVALSCRYIDFRHAYKAQGALKFIQRFTGYKNVVHTRVGSSLDTFSVIGKRANVFIKIMHKGTEATYVESMLTEKE